MAMFSLLERIAADELSSSLNPCPSGPMKATRAPDLAQRQSGRNYALGNTKSGLEDDR